METLEESSERSTLAATMELASAEKRDWSSSIQHILLVAARVLGVARVSFWELQDAACGRALVCEMAYDRTIGAFERGPTFPVSGQSDYLDAVVKLPPLAVEDVRADPRFRSLSDYLDAKQISSVLVCPVWCAGKLAGVIGVEHVGQPRHWGLSDSWFVAAAAQSASAAMEARARTQAQEYARWVAFLEHAARTLGCTLDLDEVARRAATLTIPSMADGARVAVIDDSAVRSAVAYTTAEGRAQLEAATQGPQGEDCGGQMARLVAANCKSVLVPDVTNDAFVETELRHRYPRLVGAFRALGVQSILVVPLVVGETTVGAFTLYASTRRFGLDDLGRAEELATHVAAALENARLHRCAQKALEAREEFIALAGHELRTPLTVMQLTIEDLLRRAPNDATARAARSIANQIKRLDRLSSQMLDAASLAGGWRFPCSPVPVPTDLAAVAKGAADALEPLLKKNGCTLTLQADAPVVGEWDATQLDEMLWCLLDNAVKFGTGKPIEVTVRRENGAATLSVRDHGDGLPPDCASRIFDPFERGVSRSQFGGLGLGLFIAKAIARAHGGSLSVESSRGEGATFTAHLPLKKG